MTRRAPLLLTALLLQACATVPLGPTCSLDGRRCVELALSTTGMQVRRDGQVLARHALVDPDAFALDESGAQLAYAVREGAGWRVVRSSGAAQEGPVWDAVMPRSLRVGPRGEIVYVARRGAALFVVARGRAEGPYDGVSALQIDREAAHVAYLARRGAAAWVVVDGVSRGPYEATAELALSSRGGRAAAIVRRARRWWVVGAGPAAPHESAAGLRFSESGERLAYVARDGDRERVIEQGPEGVLEGPAFARVSWRTLLVSDEETVYEAEEAGRRHAVRGGAPGPAYERVRDLVLVGGRWGYVGRRDGREQAVIDGEPGPWFEEVRGLALPATGAGHAYLARRGAALRLIAPGRELPLSWALSGSLVPCPAGGPVGLIGGRSPGERAVLLDGRALRSYEPGRPEAALRDWGPRGLLRWVAAETGPLCGAGAGSAGRRGGLRASSGVVTAPGIHEEAAGHDEGRRERAQRP